jgi:hypothetical protein
MKKIQSALIILFIAATAYSQTNKDEISYIQSIWGMEKREIVKQNMNLPENEAKDFWAVYDKYEDSRKELGKDRINTITDYVQSANNMTDAKADDFALKMLSNQTKFVDILSTAYSQMKAVVSQTKAFQFIEIELYLDTVLKLKVMEEIPFVGTMKK